jgi:hypothetical protein
MAARHDEHVGPLARDAATFISGVITQDEMIRPELLRDALSIQRERPNR